MRFYLEKPVTEKDCGKIRMVSKFLWLPKTIDHEVRWLEFASYEQVVTFDIKWNLDCHEIYDKVFFWEDSKWIDPPINLR